MHKSAASTVMVQLVVLVAGLLLIAESEASDVVDRSTLQGFLSKNVPLVSDASKSSMSDYDKFITPNLNRVKHGNELGASQDFDSPKIADEEEKRAVQKLLAHDSNKDITLSAIGFGLLSLATMLGVRMRQRGLQPALAGMPINPPPALGDNIMQMAKKKGFGEGYKVRQLTDAQKEAKAEKERAAAAYDAAKEAGIPEYRVYVAPEGTEDWAPLGVVTVPRSESVDQAIYGNAEALTTAAIKEYPKLASVDSLRWGYNLAVFPDDPVRPAKFDDAMNSTNPFLKWAKDLTNPMNVG